jgi:hypothetical protein
MDSGLEEGQSSSRMQKLRYLHVLQEPQGKRQLSKEFLFPSEKKKKQARPLAKLVLQPRLALVCWSWFSPSS